MSAAHYGTSACLRSFAQVRKSLPAANLSDQIQVVQIEDEFGRFRVWAANIGALQKGHSSLDYRLREAPLVQENVQKLLKELHSCLQEINIVLTGTRLPYDQQRPPETKDDSDSSSSEDDASSQVSSVPEPLLTELQQRFLTVVDIVDNLYKLSRMIRTPALHMRYKAADFAYVNEGFTSLRRENGDPSPQFSMEEVNLIRRFASAITKRRQQFLYWRRHRDKLGIHIRTEDFEVRTVIPPETKLPVRNATQDSQPPELPPRIVPEETFVMNAAPESSIGKVDLTATTATIFISSDNASESGQTTTSFATTARGLDGSKIELPSLPKSVILGKDFECQYCFAIIPARYQSARGWRAHVLRDLKPYVCTYPECCQPDLLFNSRHEWVEHERWEHRKVWTCPEHPSQTFRMSEDFHRHLEEQPHKISSELSFTALSDISKSSDLDSRRNCPVCLTLFAKAEQLQNHVANHLERFAAFALPRDVDTVHDDELLNGSINSSSGTRVHTDDWHEPGMLSVTAKILLIRRAITPVIDFKNGLEAVSESETTPQETKDYIDQFKNGIVAKVVDVLENLQSLSDNHMQSKELTETLDETVGSLQRLQNLLDSVRMEDLLNPNLRDMDEIKEKLESEERILCRSFTFARYFQGAVQANYVRALFDFRPTEPGELGFRKGDIINATEAVYKDWWKGSLGGRTGIIPLNYVEKLPDPITADLKHLADREYEIYERIPLAEKLIGYSHMGDEKLSGDQKAEMPIPGFNTSYYHIFVQLNAKFGAAFRMYDEKWDSNSLLKGSILRPPNPPPDRRQR
ncbi:MAG: hypothetical protein M1839_006520 [Geoglossum umbratile]|nr:MAG: hypothetical protein M1839_006520 [Geoglossum umbratile]